jgi:putative SOS response-associated peptidase YedK
MCGRFFSLISDDDVSQDYGLSVRLGLQSRFNIAPTQAVPLVHLDERGARRASLMRWGLVPAWAKEIGSAPLINARSETVAEKPSFRGAFRYRRGLLPASGWYEWQRVGKARQAYAVHFGNHAPFAFAAIWEVWEGRGEGSWLESCAILTAPAIGPVAAIHDRMPLLVEPADQRRWLKGEGDQPPSPASLSTDWVDRLILTPVSPAVGNVAAQGPQLIEPMPAAAGH